MHDYWMDLDSGLAVFLKITGEAIPEQRAKRIKRICPLDLLPLRFGSC